jgi:hypothetical protein
MTYGNPDELTCEGNVVLILGFQLSNVDDVIKDRSERMTKYMNVGSWSM